MQYRCCSAYEDLGLIHAVKRSRGGFRLFEQETTLMRLQFIQQAQSLGMSLSEIKEFLTVRDRAPLVSKILSLS